nr:hypothetical protein [Streptomyces sp. HYC2]
MRETLLRAWRHPRRVRSRTRPGPGMAVYGRPVPGRRCVPLGSVTQEAPSARWNARGWRDCPHCWRR